MRRCLARTSIRSYASFVARRLTGAACGGGAEGNIMGRDGVAVEDGVACGVAGPVSDAERTRSRSD